MWCSEYFEQFAKTSGHENAAGTVVPVLSELDFGRACWEIAHFDCWESYDDYQLEQDGWSLGFSMAGEHATQVLISLDAFHSWRNQTGAPCDLSSLRDFAAIAVGVKSPPRTRTGIFHDAATKADLARFRIITSNVRRGSRM
jgi:hypothetical protein